MQRNFASDNNAGVHPQVLRALEDANIGHVPAYGHDPFTERAKEVLRGLFDTPCEVFFVGNGTAANVLGIGSVVQPYHAILCSEWAHLQVDECGAPERFLGCKVIPVPTPDGKLRPGDLERYLHGHDDEHRSQPRVISITQATEVGTVYTPEEVRALADFAHRHDMRLHMDGARIANAAVSLGVPIAAFTADAGVDLLSLGGTKNGVMYGEAVIFFRPGEVGGFRFIRKQGMHLTSKMRFVAVQFEALFRDQLWLESARQANAMARLLADSVAGVPDLEIAYPVEANGVFARIPRSCIEPLQETFMFYVWDQLQNEVRWMCSFDTTPEDVALFAQRIREVLSETAARRTIEV